MHSHHSHSGQYVAHAKDSLQDVVEKVKSMKFEIFCLTEHMPRIRSEYLYPEEIERNLTVADLSATFRKYVAHARAIQASEAAADGPTKFLVGMEVEGVDPEHVALAADLRKEFQLDMVVGSVHHVKQIPIDFDKSAWTEAKRLCGTGTAREMFAEYYDSQYEMLTQLKPEVVGHFDLIRLYGSDDAEIDSELGKPVAEIDFSTEWPEVWAKITRNVDFIASYGGLIELNSAALRKGWKSPYPQSDVLRYIMAQPGGRLCFSDDSHGVAQVGLNYHKVLAYIQELGVQDMWYLDREGGSTVVKSIPVAEVAKSPFWKQYSD